MKRPMLRVVSVFLFIAIVVFYSYHLLYKKPVDYSMGDQFTGLSDFKGNWVFVPSDNTLIIVDPHEGDASNYGAVVRRLDGRYNILASDPSYTESFMSSIESDVTGIILIQYFDPRPRVLTNNPDMAKSVLNEWYSTGRSNIYNVLVDNKLLEKAPKRCQERTP